MSVYLRTKFSDKVFTSSCMYWVHACIYFYSLFFVLIERAHTCTYSYVWLGAHTMCYCFVPACAQPARLHPAGLPAPCWRAAHSKAAHSLQQQDTLGQEQISLLLCRQLQGSPKVASLSAAAEPLAALAAPASGSVLDSYVVWATKLHLNVVTRGRAPGVDLLTGSCTLHLEEVLIDRCNDCSVTGENALWWRWSHYTKSKQFYFSHPEFKGSTIIEEH